ncbi:MAG: hypothetical protein JSU72_12585 [Deltaproteobacteria bacterium]|nr:MAG: hypothetical protein JSU72_12585 [Deltaproteobacteria bacterium]
MPGQVGGDSGIDASLSMKTVLVNKIPPTPLSINHRIILTARAKLNYTLGIAERF